MWSLSGPVDTSTWRWHMSLKLNISFPWTKKWFPHPAFQIWQHNLFYFINLQPWSNLRCLLCDPSPIVTHPDLFISVSSTWVTILVSPARCRCQILVLFGLLKNTNCFQHLKLKLLFFQIHCLTCHPTFRSEMLN